MKTREIPHDEWVRFIDEFSRIHQGWHISVEVLDASLGAQTEISNQAFHGASVEQRDAHEVLTIMAGDSAESHLTHRVRDPRHIWIETTDEGADQALEVEDRDHRRALIRFRWALRPDLVDPAAD